MSHKLNKWVFRPQVYIKESIHLIIQLDDFLFYTVFYKVYVIFQYITLNALGQLFHESSWIVWIVLHELYIKDFHLSEVYVWPQILDSSETPVYFSFLLILILGWTWK